MLGFVVNVQAKPILSLYLENTESVVNTQFFTQ